MTETQAAIVNNRWLRHSAAGVTEAPTPRARAASGRASKVTCGGQSRNSRSGAATPARRPRWLREADAEGASSSSAPRRWLVPRPVTISLLLAS
jgi:hypothetical protein